MRRETGFAEVNGTRLYYEVAGSGHRVILNHGIPSDTRVWDDQFDVFAEHYQVVRYDMRGFGRSDVPRDDFSTTEDLKALHEYLGGGRACVVGHSVGGAVAIGFALTYPEVTDALVLADATAPGYPRPEERVRLEQKVRTTAREVGPQAANQLFGSFFPRSKKPHVAARLDQILDDCSGWHWLDGSLSRSDPNFPEPDRPDVEILGEVRLPTLVLVGDEPYFQARAEYLCQCIPGAEIEIFPDSGHHLMMEYPDRFNETVLKFLGGL